MSVNELELSSDLPYIINESNDCIMSHFSSNYSSKLMDNDLVKFDLAHHIVGLLDIHQKNEFVKQFTEKAPDIYIGHLSKVYDEFIAGVIYHFIDIKTNPENCKPVKNYVRKTRAKKIKEECPLVKTND